MSEADMAALLRATVTVVMKLGGPPLVVSLAVGIVMSLVQVITQVNEQTVSFVPKVAAVMACVTLLGAFMLQALGDFTRLLLDRVVAAGGS